jgi:hypothetical protein
MVTSEKLLAVLYCKMSVILKYNFHGMIFYISTCYKKEITWDVTLTQRVVLM